VLRTVLALTLPADVQSGSDADIAIAKNSKILSRHLEYHVNDPELNFDEHTMVVHDSSVHRSYQFYCEFYCVEEHEVMSSTPRQVAT